MKKRVPKGTGSNPQMSQMPLMAENQKAVCGNLSHLWITR